MPDNALLRDPDRGLAHFKDWDHTLVVSHIPRPEWIRALDRAFRDCTEEIPCIVGRSDWLDRFTGRRRGWIFDSTHWWTVSALPAITKWWRKNHIKATHREQTTTNRRAEHQQAFPMWDNLMSLIFLVQSDLNEQQRERFVSSMNIRQIAMPQYTYLQVNQLFLELLRRGVESLIQISRTENGLPSTP